LIDDANDPGAVIKSVKERLRSIPGGGLAYGALRYMSEDRQTGRLLEGQPQPSLLFNYLSRVRQRDDDGLFRRLSGAEDSSRDPQNIRPYPVEINAAIEAGRLGFELIYSETCHRRESIDAFSRHLLDALDLLVGHCLSPAAGGYTPSDFPDAEMSQEELDHFLDGIG
jgi:non-ribosomal peptide synthase protein (TIGR01720 family)